MTFKTLAEADQNAFPQGSHDNGLTKRELFAAMAMQGLCARDDHALGDYRDAASPRAESNAKILAALAGQAVGIADALLDELHAKGVFK